MWWEDGRTWRNRHHCCCAAIALLYVAHSPYLGHKLNVSDTMSLDSTMRRGAVVGKCMEVQETFSFAAPAEVLGAIKLYCGNL